MFQMNGLRILSFKDNPPTPIEPIPRRLLRPPLHKPKSLRHIPQGPERILDAPGIVDDLSLNLSDWGSKNILAVAIGNRVYLWNASNSSIAELVTIDEEGGPVTSVSWTCDGQQIAVGLNNSFIQLWDSISLKRVRMFRGGHQGRVGSLAWNKNILTTGEMDGRITNNDPRVRYHVVGTYKGHQQEISGLKRSDSGQHLSSGRNDNLLFIWDRSTIYLNSLRKWFHRLEDHTAAIKALAWCPFQENLLASGGGECDQCIKFWITRTGSCLNSVETGSEACGLLWNKKERELFSSHGFSDNHLVLWKYPSMVRMAELKGHDSKVLFMTQSPDGCTVATAAADERLKFWNVFGIPEVAKPAREVSSFAHMIR